MPKRALLQPERLEIAPISGSRFIASAAPVRDEAAARAFVERVREEFPDATHHCWAVRIARPSLERANDAGEPSGSAGRPILSAMIGRDVVDACVVVTRYFGGTKLGVGGLVRAYGRAAAAVLDQATLREHVERVTITLEHGYEDGPAIERALQGSGVDLEGIEYGATIVRRIAVAVPEREAVLARVRDATAGRVRVREAD